MDSNTASKIIKKIRGARELVNNPSILNLVQGIKAREHKPSATCLTGTQNQSDMMYHYTKYDRETRVNKFKAEDYYFVRNELALKRD